MALWETALWRSERKRQIVATFQKTRQSLKFPSQNVNGGKPMSKADEQTTQQWKKHVEEFQASGLTREACYAAR
jgi:hypothetical protein